MTNSGEINFDESTGISSEEQRDILAKINGITEKNRRSLTEGGSPGVDAPDAQGTGSFTAKKSGSLFPILVNVIAIAVLAGGFLLFSFFQGKTETQVREGTRVYNSAERALIDEIRKDTASRIAAKESEISLIVSKLEGVDAELQALQSNSGGLTAEQQAAENRLISQQEDYRAALSALQDERSRILEESRARESELAAQLDARTRELAAVSDQSAALSLARGELERLSRDQAQSSNVESQLAALFANLNEQIRENRLIEASGTIQTMRDFLNTPAFQSLRSIQARKELYAQSINSLDAMVDDARKNQASLVMAGMTSAGEMQRTIAGLQEENTLLKGTIEAVNSQGSSQSEQLIALQQQNGDLRADTAEKDRRIAALETEGTTLRQTVSARDSAITELQQQNAAKDENIATLSNQLAQIRQALQALSE